MALFLAMFIIGVVVVGGVSNDNWEQRLHMDAGYGTSFMNSNDIAHMSAFFCIACMFLGHQVRLRYRLIFWLAAILLAGTIIETISRGGMAALGVGLAGFLVWSSIQNRNRNRFYLYLLAILGIVAAVVYGCFFAKQFEVFSERLTTETGRSYVYSMDLFPQLMENLVIGSGAETFVRTAGNTAHNTFIYNFVCFGGIMAAVYLAWLYGLAKRIWQLIQKEGTWGANGGMLAVLFVVGIISQILSNQANLFFSFIFTTALIERIGIVRADASMPNPAPLNGRRALK
jgi:O-antigen ligase